MGSLEGRKRLGQLLTPEGVVQSLVSWVVTRHSDRLLDPSCGDGRFLSCLRASKKATLSQLAVSRLYDEQFARLVGQPTKGVPLA